MGTGHFSRYRLRSLGLVLLFNKAIVAITSAGSSKCQLASVCFELAPTVTEKTRSRGRLLFTRARNISVQNTYISNDLHCRGF